MVKIRNKWLKLVLLITIIILVMTGGLFVYIQFKIHQIKHTLSGCTLTQSGFYQEVPFDFQKLIIVSVKINNSGKRYRFILDTGAPTIISDSLLREISSDIKSTKKINITDKEVAIKESVIKLNRLIIGDLVFQDVGAMVMEKSKMGNLNCLDFDGIIGYNILQSCIFQINFSESKIVLSDQPEKMNHIKGAVPLTYTTKIQETPLISIVVNDTIKMNLTLDTGHNGFLTIENSNLVQHYQVHFPNLIVRRETRPSITIRGDKQDKSAKTESYLCLLRNLVIGDLNYQNFPVTVKNENGKNATGLIGNSFLKNFILTLNYKEKRVFLFPVNQVNPEQNKPTFGFDLLPFNEQVIVGAIYEGSPAEKCGLNIGDQVIGLDTVPLTGLSSEGLCDLFLQDKKLPDVSKDSVLVKYRKGGADHSVTFHRYNLFN